MGIVRPSNLNIRDVPGNASIVGPSTSTTCSQSTTVCETCHNTCAACAIGFDSTVLGDQCTFCACPCCDVVCGCNCNVCDREVPDGMWKSSEQYEARGRDAWGDDSSSTGSTTCLCNINPGYAAKSACNVDTGGRIICHASGTAWIVAPSASEVQRNWHSRADANTRAQAESGCSGWFVPCSQSLQNPGYSCRTYWDSYNSAAYWSNCEAGEYIGSPFANYGVAVDLSDGNRKAYFGGGGYKNAIKCVRSFRCISY